MAKKNSTEALAEMVEKGFDQLSDEMRELRKDVDRHLDGTALKTSRAGNSLKAASRRDAPFRPDS